MTTALERIIAKATRGRGSNTDDLLQIARIAEWEATQRYDPARGVPLDAYVGMTVKYALFHANTKNALTASRFGYELNEERHGRPAREPIGADVPDILVKYHIEGHTMSELAAAQGVSKTNVFYQIRKAEEEFKCRM